MKQPIDCILFVSFGGPEGPDEVIPFLENVLRGKPVPRERMMEVVEHYQHFGGVSPINAQNRDIIARLQAALNAAGLNLPIIWGNRNWKPYITDALREMQARGLQCALPVFTNIFSSYSGCRQYRENILAASQEVGDGAPQTSPRLRFGFNHPKFIAAQCDLIQTAIEAVPFESRGNLQLLFTAHSIPLSMSDNCNYVVQLKESARLIAEQLGNPSWELVYQSRSGPPTQPWLEPDIGDRIRELAASGTKAIVVAPLGFVSDHMEVLFDLDTEAHDICKELGVVYSRAAAAGTHPEFIAMLVDLILERLSNSSPTAIGNLPALHNVCPDTCCLYPRPTRPA
ncbi:MAG: ferrochelatase [Pirellulales bacterium]